MNSKNQQLLLVTASIILPAFWYACSYSGKKDAKKNSASTIENKSIDSLLQKSASFTQTNPDSVYHYALLAKKIAVETNNYEKKAKANALEVSYLRKKGNYTDAIALNLEVTNYFDSVKNYSELANNLNILADIYKELGGEKKTMEYLQKGIELTRRAEEISLSINNYLELTYSLNERGIIFRDMSTIDNRSDLMDSAFTVYEKGIQIASEKKEAAEVLPKLYNNISQVYNEHYNNYPKALEYLEKAVAINTEKKKMNSLSFNYGNISDVYMKMGNLQLANEYAVKTLAISSQINSPHRLQNAYSQLTRVNKAMKRFDSALYYKEKFIVINDSLTNLDRSKQIAEVQTKYETKEKEAKIKLLNYNVKAKNKQFYWALGGGILLAILIGLMWYQNRKLSMQKTKIAEQSTRLQLMMKELHHRVKNNLQIVSSLLNLQSYRLTDKVSINALKESQHRVQAMSLMHQRLYQVEDVSMINFRSYITDLVESLLKSYGYDSDDFDLQIKIEEEYINVDTAMPMGLLINEIITNSFKYAYPFTEKPLLEIELLAADNKLQMNIKDNGPGLKTDESSVSSGFGKKLIDALSKQLKANYSVSNNNGTVYQFDIPFQKIKAA